MTPDIDILDLGVQILPPDKRLDGFEVMVWSLLSPVDRMNRIFQQYQNGDTLSDWYDSTSTYNKGDRIKDYFGVYECLLDGTIGVAPIANKDYWYKILPCYIGVNERANYCANKIVFEYALNRYFGTTFRQYADDAYTPISDIYITTDVPAYSSFVSFTTETLTSDVYTGSASNYSFNSYISTTATTYKFTIYVPIAFYTSLGTTADQQIRFFADKINVSGMTYSITTY